MAMGILRPRSYGILRKIIYICLLVAFTAAPECSIGKETDTDDIEKIKMVPSSMKIDIDGKDREWDGRTTEFLNKDTVMGVHRDEDSIYIHILTSDPEFSMQIMNFGLTVWFDPKSERNKEIGVQFPVIQLDPPPPKERGKPPRGKKLEEFLDVRLKDIIIEFPGERRMRQMRLSDARREGICAMIGVDDRRGTICYELKYPLKGTSGSYPMGIDLGSSKHMDVCIETPEIDPSKLKKRADGPERSPKDSEERDPSSREMRPPKSSDDTKPPKPSKQPQTTRISRWIKVIF